MMRKTILNLAVSAVILVGGCAYQMHNTLAPRRAELPRPAMPETTLTTVKLDAGRKVQDVGLYVGRASKTMERLIREHEGEGATRAWSVDTVAHLKAQGLFQNSVLSDDSTVLSFKAKGGFVVRNSATGKERAYNYKGLVAIFDPASGDMLAYGLTP